MINTLSGSIITPALRSCQASPTEGTLRNHRGDVVGRLAPDGWVEKYGLNYAKHHLHRFGAWATERRHLAEMQEMGAKGMRLLLDDGRTFEATLDRWLRYYFKPAGMQSDQVALPDRFWVVHPPGARQLTLEIGIN